MHIIHPERIDDAHAFWAVHQIIYNMEEHSTWFVCCTSTKTVKMMCDLLNTVGMKTVGLMEGVTIEGRHQAFLDFESGKIDVLLDTRLFALSGYTVQMKRKFCVAATYPMRKAEAEQFLGRFRGEQPMFALLSQRSGA